MRKRTYTAKKKRWHRRRYERRFRSGLCPLCSGERTGEWIICEACREKSRARSRVLTREARQARQESIYRYRVRCRETGICYGCGRYIGLGQYKRCGACRERDRVAHAVSYAGGGRA